MASIAERLPPVSAELECDLSGLDSKELRRREQEIAKRYMGGVPWVMVFWGLGNLAVWLSLWPFVFSGLLPLWAGFLIATMNVTLCYIPSHEAQHEIIGRKGTKWHWLNELVGHLSAIPLLLPYRVGKLTHLQHHKYPNDPKLDPDHGLKAKGPWTAIWNGILTTKPGSKKSLNGYGDVLERIGRSDVVVDALIYKLIYYSILFALAWTGYAMEAIFLWWLPLLIGKIYILFFLGWAPHHPGNGTGRYDNSRAWKSKIGNIGSLGLQFHIIHHLHPTIPYFRHPAVYREMKPILQARGCDLGEL